MKICKMCNIEKSETEFSSRSAVCKPCRAEKMRKYREEHPEYAAERRANYPGYNKDYREKNKEKLNKHDRERSRERYKNLSPEQKAEQARKQKEWRIAKAAEKAAIRLQEKTSNIGKLCPTCGRVTDGKTCLTCYQREYQKKYRLDHPEKFKQTDKKRLAFIRHSRALRKLVIEAYGHKCECCGEERFEFLAIDHIHGGGKEERKSMKSEKFYRYLRDNGFPKDNYRLLCHNCNMALGIYGYCPHNAS